MIYGKKAIGTVSYMGGVMAVPEEFCWSWGQMVQWNQEFLVDDTHFVHYTRAKFSDHAPARNSHVSSFLGDWLLQLDTDHQFEPDIAGRLVRLADDIKADVLVGVYQMKTPPYLPVLYQEREGFKVMGRWPADVPVLQIASSGGGCLWVRRRVYDLIVSEMRCGPFDRFQGWSEDHSFFKRLKELNIPAYAAMKIHCNHLRTTPVTMDDYEPQEELLAAPQAVGGFSDG